MLNLSQQEISSIKAIDIQELKKRVEHALEYCRAADFSGLNLSDFGPYVANKIRKFEQDLDNLANASSRAKVDETQKRAFKSGIDLIRAVENKKTQVEEHEKERELLCINGSAAVPVFSGDQIRAYVSYKWRQTVEDSWSSGGITFVFNVDMSPDYSLPRPTKNSSRAKQAKQRQETLDEYVEKLRDLGVDAVRRFLKEGGDGSTIPEIFVAKPAGHDRYLNNLSCDFWRVEVTQNPE